jgi:hypothetical protein
MKERKDEICALVSTLNLLAWVLSVLWVGTTQACEFRISHVYHSTTTMSRSTWRFICGNWGEGIREFWYFLVICKSRCSLDLDGVVTLISHNSFETPALWSQFPMPVSSYLPFPLIILQLLNSFNNGCPVLISFYHSLFYVQKASLGQGSQIHWSVYESQRARISTDGIYWALFATFRRPRMGLMLLLSIT